MLHANDKWTNSKGDMHTFFKNLYYIASGYINLSLSFIKRKKYQQAKRYWICKKCPHKKRWTCGLCGCVIAAKVWAEYPISEIDGKSIGGCPDIPARW